MDDLGNLLGWSYGMVLCPLGVNHDVATLRTKLKLGGASNNSGVAPVGAEPELSFDPIRTSIDSEPLKYIYQHSYLIHSLNNSFFFLPETTRVFRSRYLVVILGLVENKLSGANSEEHRTWPRTRRTHGNVVAIEHVGQRRNSRWAT